MILQQDFTTPMSIVRSLALPSLTHHHCAVLEAPSQFYAGSDAAGAFARFPPEYLHVLSVGIVKKTFEMVLEYIRQTGTVRAQTLLDRRATKLNLYIWGMENYGVVKYKQRPRGITKTSRLPGEEYWCLIWFLVFSIDSAKIIKDDRKRNSIIKALIGCL
jgi:hypothetical protein